MTKFNTLPLGATFNNDHQVWEKVDDTRAKPLGAGPSYAIGADVEVRECVPRYVITYQKPGDNRTLLGAAQGRFTYETQQQAQEQLNAIQAANNASRLDELGWINLEVRVCPCYPEHFDPQTVYFN